MRRLFVFISLSSTLLAADFRDAGRIDRFNVLASGSAGPVVLFDNSHAETAGNADWTVTGAYSDFADTLRHHGFTIRSVDNGQIDQAALNGVAVVVLPEPNHRLAPGEVSALTAFVQGGGGLFAIGDHGGSDRDNDGWDSPMILNELTPQMGIKFNYDKYSESPLKPSIADSAIVTGVSALGAWGGCSLTLSGNAKVELTYGAANGSRPFVASSTFWSGRVVAIGDSSPLDDGTGAPGNHLYPQYNNPQFGIAQFALNVVNWLAKKGQEAVDH